MKRFALLVSAIFVATTLVFAQNNGTRAMKPGMMMDSTMMGNGGMGMGMGCGMMMNMMMPRVVSSTPDGIIVTTGYKLLHYDKDLNLKKQVTIPIDTANVQMMMQHMNCPMMPNKPSQQAPAKQQKK